MRSTLTEAQALLEGDPEILADIASHLLKPISSNFVARPWGGYRIPTFKGLSPVSGNDQEQGLGESFEIAAFADDGEASRHPSMLRFGDGSQISLEELLDCHGETLLGSEFVAQYGRCIPLLPKLLNVKELLSVQGHPEGNTEVYIVIEAEPGASIRLGFSEDIDPETFRKELADGRARQEQLLSLLGDKLSAGKLQSILAPWLADRGAGVRDVASLLTQDELDTVCVHLVALKSLYWRVLDSMNVIPVFAGQVIHNATPARFLSGSATAPSAEVHALGNPEGREILALEIRRPGPTFRAWDNVRFPVRDVDIESAIDALNLGRTTSKEFMVRADPVEGSTGMFRSVDSAAFRIDHLRPGPSAPVSVAAEWPHCLHALHGRAEFFASDGRSVGWLDRGESAVVPVGVGAYRVESSKDGTEIVKVSLPLAG